METRSLESPKDKEDDIIMGRVLPWKPRTHQIMLYALNGVIEDQYGNPFGAQSTPGIVSFGRRGRWGGDRKKPPTGCPSLTGPGAANVVGGDGGPVPNHPKRRRHMGGGSPQGAVEGKPARQVHSQSMAFWLAC